MLSSESLPLVLLIAHFLGLAALIGPVMLRHRPSRKTVPVMLAGALVTAVIWT